ncbi:DUF1697 domain-containing protein [Ideonella sp.]|uniref:DUF1697 domain-containing protein n=1 Tax=Ideonella sp. TaxID=1929293 RepID=UPI002B4899EE|nr:DUF1697 domain-containing protein [Ideonella sp.]HJV70598.1 DUF1697 domain-containing protein [Ideonella sp.]
MKTTTSYVGLLRGINVGKAKRMPMAELRALVGSLGYSRVETLLNSGNVVFHGPTGSADEAARRIEAALPAQFGFEAKLTVLDGGQWRELLSDNPLLARMTDPSRLLVAVWRNTAARAALDKLARQDWAPDAISRGRHAAYVLCTDGILASPAAQALDKALRDEVTTRNWATALKIGALLDAA